MCIFFFRYNNTVYRRWVICFVVYKLTNPLWLSRRNLVSLRKFLSQDAISCLGALEVSFLVISLFGYSNWMCDVRLRQRFVNFYNYVDEWTSLWSSDVCCICHLAKAISSRLFKFCLVAYLFISIKYPSVLPWCIHIEATDDIIYSLLITLPYTHWKKKRKSLPISCQP